MQLKGRHWVIGWLLLFLAVATVIVARQRAALDTAARLRNLHQTRAALEARQADLERRVRDARSRKVLVPRAESLGLHLPTDSEYVRFRLLPDPRDPDS